MTKEIHIFKYTPLAQTSLIMYPPKLIFTNYVNTRMNNKPCKLKPESLHLNKGPTSNLRLFSIEVFVNRRKA